MRVGTESQRSGLRFRALLDGAIPSSTWTPYSYSAEATSRIMHSVWKVGQGVNFDPYPNMPARVPGLTQSAS